MFLLLKTAVRLTLSLPSGPPPISTTVFLLRTRSTRFLCPNSLSVMSDEQRVKKGDNWYRASPYFFYALGVSGDEASERRKADHFRGSSPGTRMSGGPTLAIPGFTFDESATKKDASRSGRTRRRN